MSTSISMHVRHDEQFTVEATVFDSTGRDVATLDLRTSGEHLDGALTLFFHDPEDLDTLIDAAAKLRYQLSEAVGRRTVETETSEDADALDTHPDTVRHGEVPA